MTSDEQSNLIAELEAAMGGKDESFNAIAEMDSAIAQAFIGMAKASAHRGALEPKYRALISMSLSASCTHLKHKFTRLHMIDALNHGATREEICEILELASVLGIHGVIPGVQILTEIFGGIAGLEAKMSPEQLARAKEAADEFTEKRGFLGDVWWANCLLTPEFVKAYADYSGTPWKTHAVPPKIKEMVYVAIDLSPTHGDVGGATHHLKQAMEVHGATLDEMMECLELIGLMGIQTHMLALPILKEQLDARS